MALLDAIDLDDDYMIWTEPSATVLVGIDDNLVPIFRAGGPPRRWAE
jgi:hypothetical protein